MNKKWSNMSKNMITLHTTDIQLYNIYYVFYGNMEYKTLYYIYM